MKKSKTYLDLGVIEHVSQVLRDTIIWAQILLSEVDGLLVGQDRGRVRTKELLLDSHVVVGDGEHSSAVLCSVGWSFLFLLLEGGWVKSLSQHDLLQQDHSTHRMVESQLVLVQLRQNRTDVQMGVGLDLGSLQARLDGQCTLQEV